MKIVLLEPLGISPERLAELKKPFEEEGHCFADYARSTDPEVLKQETADADAVILANMPFKGEVIEACNNLKYIDIAFTGVDHVDLKAAAAKNIAVSNASGYSTEAVAELSVGLTLNLLRFVKETEARCRNEGDKSGYMGSEIKGKTVGIIGLGNIGGRSAELFHAFGAEVLAYSRTFHADAAEYVKQVSLDELLANSDIVVLHCPINDQSRGLINKENIAKMKDGAILINAARGPVVVDQDLYDALESGKLAGAGLDVFDKEPPLPADHLLLKAKNTIVVPHIGFFTKEAMAIRADIVFDNLRSWLDGDHKNKVL
ncbi:MAG: hydroxyacid dehydrogenase [Erysipelotrichaceae bacterium]|nr:hydroxyacid dehydrogenase [Erysipelotrichaceae bacterium]MBR4122480.1 hydroxyacid dehydrogenase [Erysipelotrichaceae bacterium]